MNTAHSDPVTLILVSLLIILSAAKLGSIISNQLKQPLVLGELVAGITLACCLCPCLQSSLNNDAIQVLASLGSIILLFEVGLETNLKEMAAVGLKSFWVACVGVICPFILGYFLSGMLIPDLTSIAKIFMGATLTATSVGITARVFKDLNYMHKTEARIVLGAAVIDDVLGLIILAVVSGIAINGNLDIASVGLISLKAILFLGLSLGLGFLLAGKVIKVLSYFNIPGLKLSLALIACFSLSYLAAQAGLATIVGAFAAGLILDEIYFKDYDGEQSVEELIKPISYFLVPIFFVITGFQVDLSVFANQEVLIAALVISLAAMLSKLVSGWAFSGSGLNRLIIGVAMIPRGEVGLIFASAGKAIGVIDDRLYAITVIVVVLTTLIPPIILGKLINSNNSLQRHPEGAKRP